MTCSMKNETVLKVFQFKFSDYYDTDDKVIEVYARDIKEARLILEAWLKTFITYKHDNGKCNSKRTKELEQDEKLSKRLTMKALKEEYKLAKLKFEK